MEGRKRRGEKEGVKEWEGESGRRQEVEMVGGE